MDLQSLLAAAIEVLTTFLTVSYLASTATEGLSSALNLRAKRLMQTIRELLNETHNSAPVTLAIYNSYIFNPRAPPPVDTIAAVTSLPTIVDPRTFARALMDVLKLEGKVPEDMLRAIGESQLQPDVQNLARELIQNHANDDEVKRGDLTNIQLSIAHWFERAVGHTADDYRRMTQLANFIIGLILAALLGLSPLPKSLMESGLLGDLSKLISAETEWPIKFVGYIIVAVSTIYGAPFWFSLIKMISPIKPDGIDPGAAAGAPKGAVANGAPTTGTPSPDQAPSGPAPPGPSAGLPEGPAA